MRTLRSAIAIDPRYFGRRTPRLILSAVEQPKAAFGDDFRLFTTAFAVGFLFVSVLIF